MSIPINSRLLYNLVFVSALTLNFPSYVGSIAKGPNPGLHDSCSMQQKDLGSTRLKSSGSDDDGYSSTKCSSRRHKHGLEQLLDHASKKSCVKPWVLDHLRGGASEVAVSSSLDKAKQRAAERSAKFKEWVAEQKKKSNQQDALTIPMDQDEADVHADAMLFAPETLMLASKTASVGSLLDVPAQRVQGTGAAQQMARSTPSQKQNVDFIIYSACQHPTSHAIIISHVHNRARDKLKEGHMCLALAHDDVPDELGYMWVTVLPVSSASHEDVIPAAEYAAEKHLESLHASREDDAATSLFPRYKVLSECLRQVGHVACAPQESASSTSHSHWKIAGTLSPVTQRQAAHATRDTADVTHAYSQAFSEPASFDWERKSRKGSMSSSNTHEVQDLSVDTGTANGKTNQLRPTHPYQHVDGDMRIESAPDKSMHGRVTTKSGGDTRTVSAATGDAWATPFSQREAHKEARQALSSVVAKNKERLLQMYNTSKDIKAFLAQSSPSGDSTHSSERYTSRSHQERIEEPITAEARVEKPLEDDDIRLDRLLDLRNDLDVLDRRTPSPARRLMMTPPFSRYVLATWTVVLGAWMHTLSAYTKVTLALFRKRSTACVCVQVTYSCTSSDSCV
jgi:hypothetical protein